MLNKRKKVLFSRTRWTGNIKSQSGINIKRTQSLFLGGWREDKRKKFNSRKSLIPEKVFCVCVSGRIVFNMARFHAQTNSNVFASVSGNSSFC